MHVWQAAEGETPGVDTIVPPQTDVPIELASDTLLEYQVERAVLVQPVFRGEDNTYVAACAARAKQVRCRLCRRSSRAGGRSTSRALGSARMSWIATAAEDLRGERRSSAIRRRTRCGKRPHD